MFKICLNYDKCVDFNDNVSVILIPNLDDYYEKNLVHKLWWSNKDIKLFLVNYQKKVQRIMNLKNVPVKVVMKIVK